MSDNKLREPKEFWIKNGFAYESDKTQGYDFHVIEKSAYDSRQAEVDQYQSVARGYAEGMFTAAQDLANANEEIEELRAALETIAFHQVLPEPVAAILSAKDIACEALTKLGVAK